MNCYLDNSQIDQKTNTAPTSITNTIVPIIDIEQRDAEHKIMKRRTAIALITGGFGAAALGGWSTQRNRNMKSGQELMTNKEFIDALVDTIIPKTDSPSASEVGTTEFLVSVINQCTEQRDKLNFYRGLDQIHGSSIKLFQKKFDELDLEKKQAIVNDLEQQRNLPHLFKRIKQRFLGVSFLDQLISITVQGYCSSKIITENYLDFEPIPITYTACYTESKPVISKAI